MSKRIFVDFDSTLTTGEGEPHWEEPLEEIANDRMIYIVNQLYNLGHTIVIYTARRESYRRETEYFLKSWDVKYHALVMEKPGYDLLIDDRAISDEKGEELGVEGIEDLINE